MMIRTASSLLLQQSRAFAARALTVVALGNIGRNDNGR